MEWEICNFKPFCRQPKILNGNFVVDNEGNLLKIKSPIIVIPAAFANTYPNAYLYIPQITFP